MGRALIVAGDIGGTKTYLAAFDPTAQEFSPVVERRYETTLYASAGALLAAFIAETNTRATHVILGVPGPVRQLPVRAVNLPWFIDPGEISTALSGVEVHLLNDLQATSYGTLALTTDDLCALNGGDEDKEGNIAVIAAGTGLGEGGLCWTGDRYHSIASEGGHASFAPTCELEVDLWRYLNQRHGHVSWERVVAGPGLASTYDFLCDRQPERESAALKEELAQGDRSDTISRAGLDQRCELAAEALDLYTYLYGCEAGNLALKLMSSGGVFVGGGIAPKILNKLRDGRFMEGFVGKGRMGEPLEDIPVQVVLNDKTALLGAAYWGMQL
ncbi:MAG TPA: glucokinase [Candidatus Latescibacteria bacterium]|nr:glucokinase [Candidatus Handelsmanbacteria bacterium]HIL10813.1 glucokinase [Candidatus Latescibacterota bacterium]